MTEGLRLFEEDEFRDFLRRSWPAKPCLVPPNKHRQDLAEKLHSFSNVQSICRGYGKPISFRNPSGENGRVTSGTEALQKYQESYTLYFRHVETESPQIAELLNELGRRLGMNPNFMAAEVFASNGSSGVAMHSDYDINFQWLVRGRKRWLLAKNVNVINQTEMCLPDTGGNWNKAQEKIAEFLPFPAGMPSVATTFEASAGSIVYMPFGWWHETAAQEECFAINLVIKAPRWFDVLSGALAERLKHSSKWREYAYGIFSDDPSLRVSETNFEDLVRELSSQLITDDPSALAAELLREYIQKACEHGA